MAAYQAAKAQAGRDADAQVKLALWCEAHGLSAERIKHLTLATLLDPSNAAARGLLGLVAYQGKWSGPTRSAAGQRDPARKAALREYLERRARTPDRAEDHWKLALWCDQNGLKPQAVAHLHRVVELDPRREAAWKRLGFKKQNGQLGQARRRRGREGRARGPDARRTSHWKPRLEKWRDGLAGRDRSRRAAAEEALGQMTDPAPCPWSGWSSSGATSPTSESP